jgi:hypothetical protein
MSTPLFLGLLQQSTGKIDQAIEKHKAHMDKLRTAQNELDRLSKSGSATEADLARARSQAKALHDIKAVYVQRCAAGIRYHVLAWPQ